MRPPLFIAKLHWIIFRWPVLLLMFALFAAFYIPIHEITWFFVLLSLSWTGFSLLQYYFSSLTITVKGIVFRTGIFIRKTTDIPYHMIETIDVQQSIFGTMLRYGLLSVTGSGGTRHFINPISEPLTCRRYIEELIQKRKNDSR